jgi:RTX calcium-binding nonapeptide repeat (4 copies)
MRRTILSLMALVALSLVVVGGTASAKVVQCKPHVRCFGTKNDDRLIGTSRPDDMAGHKGDDVLKGREGNDTMRGDKGRDRLLGGPGEDSLDGGAGKDVLKGGADFDRYLFNENNWGKEFISDTPIVHTDIDTGHTVQFNLVTNNLTVNLTSGPGPEVKNATTGSTLNWEDNLIDIVVSGKGDDTVIGRAVADKIVDPGGSDDQDTIFAGGGDDFISTFDGDGLDVVACDGGTNDKLRKDAGDMQFDCELVF